MGQDNSMKEQLLENGGAHGRDGGGGGITAVLVCSILVAVCSSYVCGCAMGYTSPVQAEILGDLGLSTADFSLFGSMLTIGALIGSLFCGRIADYIGRRYTMALSSIVGIVGWIAIALAKDAWSLDVGRFALGLAVGFIVYVVPVYIAEITPKNLRGGSVLLHQLMSSTGIASAYILGLAMPWRTLALMGAIPCIVQLVGLFFIPESPRWLVKVGNEGYASALQKLRGKDADISSETAEMKGLTADVENLPEDKLLDVFQMKYAYALVVSLGLMALSQFGGTNGVLFYATNTFQSAGVSVTLGTIAMGLVQLPPMFIGVYLMDKFGRRPLLLFSAFGMGTACFSVALSFLMKEHGWLTHFSPYLALVGILLFSATFPVGLGGIPFVIMSEIFPINVKGAAGSLATIVSWSSGWLVSYAFNFMMGWSSSGTFFIFSAVNIFAVLFVGKLVPETKGKTLEEIQEVMTLKVY